MIETCSIDWCDRPASAKGLCAGHAERERLGRDMHAPWRVTRAQPGYRTPCAVEGCFRPVEGGGFCGPHSAQRAKTEKTAPEGPERIQFQPADATRSPVTVYRAGQRAGEIKYRAETRVVTALVGHWHLPGVMTMSWDAARLGRAKALRRARAWVLERHVDRAKPRPVASSAARPSYAYRNSAPHSNSVPIALTPGTHPWRNLP